MDLDENQLYSGLTGNIQSLLVSKDDIAKANPTIESEVTKIYTQASTHRNRLVWFYIYYTASFTLLLFVLIFMQGVVRITQNNPDFIIMPQWSLNILVTGMFGQFLILLQLITKKVWDFKHFFDYHEHMEDRKQSPK